MAPSASLPASHHRVDRDAHVLDPVEAVEDAEEVHAGLGRAADEIADDIVGIVGVADAVGAAQQHLRQDVGRPLADQRQPLPRVLVEEAHGDVEGRAAPAFERQQLRQAARIGLGDGDDVVGAHARRQQRLVRVAHRRVGDEHARLGLHPFGESLRAAARRGAAWCRARALPSKRGASGARASAGGLARPRASGWPLTVTSAI